jgi:CRISPR-associated protein Csx14
VLSSLAGVTIAAICEDLARSAIVATAPHGSGLEDKNVFTEEGPPYVFPAAPPDKPSALPIRIKAKDWSVTVSSRAESNGNGRDNSKFWAGNYTGASAAALALALIAERDADTADPFSFAASQTSSFRLDWRRDYIPLDSGFSPNALGKVEMVGYPLVELLAAIGLEHTRPFRPDPRDKLRYDYAVPTVPAPLTLIRAAVSGAEIGLPLRLFSMTLGWPGQEGQARCILDAQEITQHA